MKRVAITGATSMIGVALIEECIKHEIQVLAIIRKGSTRLSRLPKSSYICDRVRLTCIVCTGCIRAVL